MRHDAIHSMSCACQHCAAPRSSVTYHEPVVDSADLHALRKGIVCGLWAGGLLAAGKFGPSIVDWLAAQ